MWGRGVMCVCERDTIDRQTDCGRVTNPSEGFIMAYWIAFLDEVEHNLRVFLYTTEASAASECESGTLS